MWVLYGVESGEQIEFETKREAIKKMKKLKDLLIGSGRSC